MIAIFPNLDSRWFEWSKVCFHEIHPKIIVWWPPRTIFDIAIIFSPNWETLQSYVVRYGIQIAIIFGPFSNEDCIHIRSSFWSSLQSYLIPMIKIIAIICGPPLYPIFFVSQGITLLTWKDDPTRITPSEFEDDELDVFKLPFASCTCAWPFVELFSFARFPFSELFAIFSANFFSLSSINSITSPSQSATVISPTEN